MNPDTLNKSIGTGLILSSLVAAVYFGATHVNPPDLVTIIAGGAFGLGSHLLGVVSGSSTTLKGIDTANNASFNAMQNSDTSTSLPPPTPLQHG